MQLCSIAVRVEREWEYHYK